MEDFDQAHDTAHVLRLPSGSLHPAYPARVFPIDEGPVSELTLVPCDFSFAEDCHGLIGKAGLARLQEECGMSVDWANNSISFRAEVTAVERYIQPVNSGAALAPDDQRAVDELRQALMMEFHDVFRDELPGPPPPRRTD